MQDLIVSMMKFSAAMTLFGMQQIQNAVGAAVDTETTLEKFRQALDAMTDAMAKHMDESKTETLKSVDKVQSDMVHRTWDAMNIQALDPREMMSTSIDLMKKTTDSFSDMVNKTIPKSGSSEPKAAAEALKN